MRLPILKAPNILAVVLIFLATLTVSSALAFEDKFAGATDKPADPDYTYFQAIFDCLPPDSLTVRVNSAYTLSDSTVDRQSNIDSYPCAPWNELGPELIYRLDVATDLELSAVLTESSSDLDLFLLDDCDSETCLVGAANNFNINLTPGIYFLIVDTASSPAIVPGTFTLDLTTRELGVPLSICEPEGATVITCANDTTTFLAEELFEQPDLIREASCNTSPRRAGEKWYAIKQGPGNEVIVAVSNVAANLDVNIWLFDGCGPEAVCLQYVDAGLANEGETLTWTNTDPVADVTVYLAVDAARVPDPVAPLEVPVMTYDIEFFCQGSVPMAKTSLGTLKSLYR